MSFDKLRMSGVFAVVLLTATMCLTGCQKSFDERYAEAQEKMASQAASIDQELATKASEAALGETAASEAAGMAPAIPDANPSPSPLRGQGPH